ncbi:hypothetical protein ACIBAC_43700 [Streptomyces sp. NPDC051362]|uniref:hypothetical protein n=1 Tax=Streptomyces sp. NPDC051362 TaxID=3365651 RepID=UPI0037A493C6
MEKEQLFTGLENPRRGEVAAPMQVSPLHAYVLDVLPADLAAVSGERLTYRELAAKQEMVLTGLGAHGLLVDDVFAARMLQLDLLFMRGGYLPAGPGGVPSSVTDAISAQCSRFPTLDPHLSYELLIDVNSGEWNRSGNMRVFTEGETGRFERDFYLGHYLAEPTVRAAFDSLIAVIREPDTVDMAETFEGAVKNLESFRLHMAQYGKLPKEAFNSFRRYHMGHPGGPRGASGAFMPSVQLLELALLPPTKEYEVYLDQSLPYFPLWSRPIVGEWREASREGDNVVQAVIEGRLKIDRNAKAALLALIDKFADFRLVHLGVTKKSIPDAFPPGSAVTRNRISQQSGEAEILSDDNLGTSGFNVRNVLINSVYRLLAARKRIELLTINSG